MHPNTRTREHKATRKRTNATLFPQGPYTKKTYTSFGNSRRSVRNTRCSEYPQFKVFERMQLCPTAYAFAQSCSIL